MKSSTNFTTLFILLWVYILVPACSSSNVLKDLQSNNQTTFQHNLNIYRTYEEVSDAANGKLIIINQYSPQYSGYSILPFGSRDKAAQGAIKKAQGSNEKNFLVVFDAQKKYSGSSPPPGCFLGGIYRVYSLLPFQYVDLNEENLLSEIKTQSSYNRGLSAIHLRNLLNIARDQKYKNFSDIFRSHVKSNNRESADGSYLYSLVNLIGYYEGATCIDEMIKWAKYHKNDRARLAAYLQLIEFGKIAMVEEILKFEENKVIKDQVENSLL